MSEEKISLCIAEILFCFHVPPENAFSNILHEKYGSFVVPHDSGAVSALNVHVDVLPRGEKKDNELHVRHEDGSVVISRGDMKGALHVKSMTAGLVSPAYITSIDTFLRASLTFLLLEKNGFLLHSAGIIMDGKGYCFFGPSGSGKTTFSEKFGSGVILSDEVCAVTSEGGGVFAHGTPFWGDLARRGGSFGSPVKIPLGGFFRLEKGVSFQCESMKVSEAFKEMLQSVIFYGASGEAPEKLFHIVGNVVERSVCRRLWLTKDMSAVSALEHEIKKDVSPAYVPA